MNADNTCTEAVKHNNAIIFAHYEKWAPRIASSLWKIANMTNAMEATQNAVLKVLGMHDRYKLEKPMPAMSEGELYTAIRNQAKWMLSHEFEKSKKFVSYVEDFDEENENAPMPTQLDESQYNHHDYEKRDSLEMLVVMIRKVLRNKGFKECFINGFLDGRIAGLSSQEVLAKYPRCVSTGNFDKVVCLMKKVLVKAGKNGELAEFRYAA